MPKRASLKPVETDRKSAKWMVNLPVHYSRSGRRERHFFGTKTMAQTFCDQIKTNVANYGSQAQVLSPAQLEQASQAFEKLAAYKVSLNTVVEEWIAKRQLANASIPFEQLLEEFSRGGRRQRPRSPSYTLSINQTRNRLTSLHGRVVSEITPRDIEKAVKGMVPSVRNYTLKILSCALNVGISRGYLTENPIRKVELTHVSSGEIAVYTPQQVTAIMSVAEETNQSLIPFLAISFFAGVRRSEILETTQEHYAKAATQKEARAFWEIEPSNDLAKFKTVLTAV